VLSPSQPALGQGGAASEPIRDGDGGMLFNSHTFFVFLALVIGITRLRWSWTGKKAFLLLMSYVFYAAWNPPFVILLWISTLADWHIAARLARAKARWARRGLLLASLGVNLGLLGYFKYAGFFLENIEWLGSLLGQSWQSPEMSIVLPVGISFYTFQTLSYTLDVYRGDLRPWHNFLDYALYVTFFPQLVAGPIVRASDFLPQCERPRRATSSQLGWGLVLIVSGLFAKVVIADAIMSPVVERLYDVEPVAGAGSAWVGTVAFAAQIYSDFAGYSTCAIGAALCLGFRIPDNFRYPYAAVGFSDFWRRWHISLSTWLRDYLYISLGGNRRGPGRTYVNLMLTMLIGGLWHGASWSFVVWGGMHGGFLVSERLARPRLDKWGLWSRRPIKLLLMLLTFGCVCFTWVYFRAEDFQTANRIAGSMLGLAGLGPGLDAVYQQQAPQAWIALFVAAGVVVYHWLMRNRTLEDIYARVGWIGLAAILGFMIFSVFIEMGAEDRAFIYFQF
jgi:D-alanyl-lipoteichoic acid acyltransferase DltB (MBOAT superfamily)